MVEIASLHTYPIKSCAGLSHRQLELGPRGPVGDRRCMVVDPRGRFVTQREAPRLALVSVTEQECDDGPGLTLHAPDAQSITVPLAGSHESIGVEVWRFRGDALCVGPEVDDWLTAHLGTAVRLVRCPPRMTRVANRAWVDYDAPISFADGYPILLISEASLDELNARLGGAGPLPMARFRPNVVVRGCPPFAEDDWRSIRIGEAVIDLVKPCDRCGMTTVDPETAERGKEPLRTLATFRRSPSGVLFGQNCAARVPGSLHVGDPVEVLEAGRLARTPPAWRIGDPAAAPA